jgi:hypothetical protein
MPASVRVLDTALQSDSISARLKILRTALAGGRGDVPGVDMEALSATANQFVDDMEDQEVGAGDRVVWWGGRAQGGMGGWVGRVGMRMKGHGVDCMGASSGALRVRFFCPPPRPPTCQPHSNAHARQTPGPPFRQVVADRVLLARLVLIREELRALNQRAKERAAWDDFASGGSRGPGSGGGGTVAATAAATAAAAAAAKASGEQRGGVLYGPGEAPLEGPAATAAGTGGAPRDAATPGAAGLDEDTVEAVAMAAAADDGGFFSFNRGNLPRRCAAFVKALLAVGEPPRRVALLRKVRCGWGLWQKGGVAKATGSSA